MTLSCLACRAVFASSELLKQHYQCEWHRYNLKRKVVELPPVTFDEFESKKSEASKSETKSLDSNQQLRCTACSKNFQSTKALNNHLNSAKHQQKKELQDFKKSLSNDPAAASSPELPTSVQASLGNSEGIELIAKPEHKTITVPPGMEGEGDDEWESEEEMEVVGEEVHSEEIDLNPALCVFCEELSDSVDLNRQHMEDVHSFFIPFPDLLVDLEGLLSYLHEKVQSYRMCVFCSERGRMFPNATAVRKHMADKGHQRMAHETTDHFLEYVEYYDDSSTEEVHLDEERLTEMIMSALNDQFEMVLPSGATIGHRALQRYYRQRPFAPNPNNLPRARQPPPPKAVMAAGSSSSKVLVPASTMRNNMNKLGFRIKELKMLQRYRARATERMATRTNNLKTHSQDQTFWNMRY